jgi:ubiquinone biosynthesis protein Coq4
VTFTDRLEEALMIAQFRTLKALYSLAQLVRDPDRLGQVFEMADALATPEKMTPVIDRLAKDPVIARALEERHRIRIDLGELRRLPVGTFGRTFADHMIANNLDPSALPDLPSGDRISFFRAHLYETHDVWHVATGFGTDLIGELGLQAFYLAQIPGPLPALLVAVGFLRSAIYDQELTVPFMDALVSGWRMGTSARPLFGVHWDELWSTPVDDVRRRLGVAPAAVIPPVAIAA